MTSSLWPQIRAAKEGVFWAPVGTLFTVNGTGAPDPSGRGFPGDMARALIDVAEGMWTWQPIGYPAAAFPMGPSVQRGRSELCAQLERFPGRIAMSGYSQGALVVDIVWRDDILDPRGRLHHRLEDVVAIINFGDPMRCPGIANGNKSAGRPLPRKVNGFTSGGIAGSDNLTPAQTPDFLLSFATDGDLYACAPVGDDPWEHETEVGHNERIIFDVIQNATPTTLLAISLEVAEILGEPLQQVVPLVQAILNGGMFLVAPGPHGDYDIGPGIRYLIERGQLLRAEAALIA